MAIGQFTLYEIKHQSKSWEATLAGFTVQEKSIQQFVTGLEKQNWIVTGCGSTYYASLSVAALLRRYGITAWAYPASEIVHFPHMLPRKDVNLLTISRSGTTTETMWAVAGFREKYPDGKVVSITTQPGSRLALASDIVLSAESAQEKSVAQTRSFTSMLMLGQCLAGIMGGDRDLAKRLQIMPRCLDELVERIGNLPRVMGEDASLSRFFFLGGGPFYGLACEAMLKTKEMTRSWAEAFHPLEFRHGPMSVVDDHSLVVCLVSDSEQTAEASVVRDMQKLGARILILTENTFATDWAGIDHVVDVKCGLGEWERGALYLPFIHWMDYYRTLANGLDPDNPTNLTAVIEL